MRIEPLGYDHPDAKKLIAELQDEYVVRYGGPDTTPVDPAEFSPPLGLFLVGYVDEVPLVSGGWRFREDQSAVEMKRMYVAPQVRGRGYSRIMLAALERAAVEAGYRRLILETGQAQPEAIALYRSAGYTDVPGFGVYADDELSVYLGRTLLEP